MEKICTEFPDTFGGTYTIHLDQPSWCDPGIPGRDTQWTLGAGAGSRACLLRQLSWVVSFTRGRLPDEWPPVRGYMDRRDCSACNDLQSSRGQHACCSCFREMAETSGETPSRAKELEDRLTTMLTLSRELGAHGLYSVIDPTSIGTEIDKARATEALDRCNGCERDLARLVHADRVLIGAVDKVSTLIGSLRLSIVDVATAKALSAARWVFGATRMMRGNAPRDFVRDLAATAAAAAANSSCPGQYTRSSHAWLEVDGIAALNPWPRMRFRTS